MDLLDLETNREKREDGEGGRRRGCLKGGALATAGTQLSLGGAGGNLSWSLGLGLLHRDRCAHLVAGSEAACLWG